MNKLAKEHCVPCEGGVDPITKEAAQNILKSYTEWTLSEDAKYIERKLSFKNFYATMSFVNAVAYMAQKQGHHPDLKLGYNYCHVRYSTHAIDGLSHNDFICAARVDELLR